MNNTSIAYKSALEIFARAPPVIGSQSHPARSVSAQRDTRSFIRRPSLLFLPHTYRKHLFVLYLSHLYHWNGFIALRQLSRAPLLTRPQIIVRANVIKRIAPQVYGEGTATSKRMMELMKVLVDSFVGRSIRRSFPECNRPLNWFMVDRWSFFVTYASSFEYLRLCWMIPCRFSAQLLASRAGFRAH